jgi:DNA-binding transcriptional MerR regulator
MGPKWNEANAYRIKDRHDLQRLELMRRARNRGFSLGENAERFLNQEQKS